MTKEKMEKYKQTEKNKTIEDFKRVIAMYFKYSDYDLFCSNLMKSGIKGTIQNTMADMINLIEKLQKENEEYKLLNANIEKANRIIEGKEEYIPKSKIRKLEDMWNDNIWNATDDESEAKAEMIRDVYRGLLNE